MKKENKVVKLSDKELEQVSGGKIRGLRDTSVSFDDCPQGEEFREGTCLWCEHFDVCWPSGMVNGRLVN